MEKKDSFLAMKFIKIKNVSLEYQKKNLQNNNIRSKLISIFSKKKLQNENIASLKNINLTINEGERVGFIGSNGSGKTTLLKIVSDIIYPTRGEVIVCGKVSSIFDPSLGMDPEASGIENIIIRCKLLGLNNDQIRKKLVEISEFSELENSLNHPIKTYSAGMTVRLAFSIATAVEPEILVMDEWLSAGDARFVNKALEKMKHLVMKSSILLLASHSETILLEWCNRLIWIEGGEIIEDGSTEKVLTSYRAFSEIK
jgi:lipopolysaccharide transport system ATP-binding protein